MVVATRPLRGSRLSSFYAPVPEGGPSLSDLDSAFQLQEYISLLIQKNPHDVETIVTPPGRVIPSGKNDDKAELEGKNGNGNDGAVDEACWIYEQLRRLSQDLTHPLITSLQQECTRASCPEMKAGEWLYLCVAHGNDGAMEQCCAIDYIIHTLDSATALLNSPRAFPSRISIPWPSIRHFASLARRLGRIFAHAYFHHREAFESSEAENSLYARFLALTARFDLVPAEFLVIPPRMTSSDASSTSGPGGNAEPPRLLAAALHPYIPDASKGSDQERSSLGPGMTESPRKVGRNRTDTMVLSDVEAFNEALRGQSGSPSSSAQGAIATRGGLGLDTFESEKQDEGGIPTVGSLDIVTDSPEIRLPSSADSEAEKEKEDEKETKPYTLTFSASGTMKTALPPGVSPSSSSSGSGSNIGLSPGVSIPSNGPQPGSDNNSVSDGSIIDDASQFRERGRAFADAVSIEERAPMSDGDGEDLGEEQDPDQILPLQISQEPEGLSDNMIDLLARRQVLAERKKRMSMEELEEATEWFKATNVIMRADDGGGPKGEVEVEGEGEGDEFVVIGDSTEKMDDSEPTEFESVDKSQAQSIDDKAPATSVAENPGSQTETKTADESEVSADTKPIDTIAPTSEAAPKDSEEKIPESTEEKTEEGTKRGIEHSDTSLDEDITADADEDGVIT